MKNGNDKNIPPVKESKPEEILQNGSGSRESSNTSAQCVKNGNTAIKALDKILAVAESSEESDASVKPDVDSDVEVTAIEEDMNLEDLMRQKVSQLFYMIVFDNITNIDF